MSQDLYPCTLMMALYPCTLICVIKLPHTNSSTLWTLFRTFITQVKKYKNSLFIVVAICTNKKTKKFWWFNLIWFDFDPRWFSWIEKEGWMFQHQLRGRTNQGKKVEIAHYYYKTQILSLNYGQRPQNCSSELKLGWITNQSIGGHLLLLPPLSDGVKTPNG